MLADCNPLAAIFGEIRGDALAAGQID